MIKQFKPMTFDEQVEFFAKSILEENPEKTKRNKHRSSLEVKVDSHIIDFFKWHYGDALWEKAIGSALFSHMGTILRSLSMEEAGKRAIPSPPKKEEVSDEKPKKKVSR